MKKIIFHILIMTVILALASCKSNEIEAPLVQYQLNLSTSVGSMYDQATKVALLDTVTQITDKTLKLYGWSGTSYWIKGEDVTYSSGSWSVSGSYSVKKDGSYSYLSYANMPSSGASITAPDTKDGNLTLTVSDITAAQSDVLLGRGSVSSATSGNVNLNFSHPFASVRFKLGNAAEIESVKSISLGGIHTQGKTTFSQSSVSDADGVMEYTWTNKSAATGTLETSGLTVTEGQVIATFVVIPQDLATDNAVVTLYDNYDNQLTKVISDGNWTSGYTTTYTLDKIVNIEVTLSSTSISNSGASKVYVRSTITGAWYDSSGNIVAPWDSSKGTFTGVPGSGWVKSGGDYYYSSPLATGQSASALYSSYAPPSPAPVAGATLKLDVLVQAIPYNVNKSCIDAFAAL